MRSQKANYGVDGRVRERKRSLTPPARGGRNKCLSPLDLVPVPERNEWSVCPHRGTNGVSVPRRVIKAADRVSVPRKAGQGSGGVFHAREGRIFSASASSAGSFSLSQLKRM